ncbi:MAG: N(4)-(beta-N-acetylglucosaminyl)-L-asparaginase [Longimicrobiales bacterium]
MSKVDRRDFIRSSVALGAGAAAMGRFPEFASAGPSSAAGIPLIITSHTNETGQEAMRQAWEILSSGGEAMDAVEKGANVIEVDPEDSSVGYGGLPNAEGVVQLDASCMDGKTYNAGAVASLEGIKTPASIARLVMERTDHVLMVGPGAQKLALSFGYPVEDLMTERSRQAWIRWRERLSETDDWGPPDHLRGGSGGGSDRMMEGPEAFHYGTTNVLAVDANGNISGITTTSGLSWKIPGRVGDSPIIGAGLYVDNSVGAAGATGRGEDVIKSCASYYIVGRMRDGRTPQQACEDAVDMILDRYRAIGNDFVPGEKFVAINKAGDYGCCSMPTGRAARMTVRHAGGLEVYEGSTRG